ncbi:MAG: exodeoxyribonuclease VII large subunit [Nostocoides sp.]
MSGATAQLAAETTAENPWPLRLLSMKMEAYVERMSVIWIEAQVVELTRRQGSAMAYLTLRDIEVDMSLPVAIRVTAVDAMPMPLTQGARVVVQCKAQFWSQRGRLVMDARQIRPVGLGELLARLEYLKATLAAEGLFADGAKRPLPFLPRRVGLITGRDSAAERDVVQNARRRWPAVAFEIRNVAVQGSAAVTEVSAALADLEASDEVDVIVIARGGGSVEDLLPFSNETLVRAVSRALTPVVSAIGHEVDTPLLDLVADARASTPTDAAKLVVPDAASERAGIAHCRDRARAGILRRWEEEVHELEAIRARPVLADPGGYARAQRESVRAMMASIERSLRHRLARDRDSVIHLRAQCRALSPQSTLERGYAIVSDSAGRAVTDPGQVGSEPLLIRLYAGTLTVRRVTDEAHTSTEGTSAVGPEV